MARLPVPGADSGNWGDVLNDYLAQVHASDGQLKDDSVGVAQLQDNSVTTPAIASGAVTNGKLGNGAVTTAILGNGAVTTTKLADGSVTVAKLAAAVPTADSLRSLQIFYAPPTTINAKFSVDYAAGLLARYDDVVLGTGLEDPGNAYYADTVSIVAKATALSPSIVFWGYIDTGVSTGNLSIATLQTQIDQWVAAGAKGIFCDVFGYDYGVSRTRQNQILDYIHSKNIGAILNVWDSDQALGSQVDATYNPSGAATHASSNDVLLLESWVFNSDAYSSPYYATFSDIKTRADKARTYRANLGIRIFATNIILQTGLSENDFAGYRGMAEALARVFRLDGSGVAAASYSSTGTDVGVVNPRKKLLSSSPARPTAPYVLNGSWTQVEAPDLGITVSYDVGTHTWQEL